MPEAWVAVSGYDGSCLKSSTTKSYQYQHKWRFVTYLGKAQQPLEWCCPVLPAPLCAVLSCLPGCYYGSCRNHRYQSCRCDVVQQQCWFSTAHGSFTCTARNTWAPHAFSLSFRPGWNVRALLCKELAGVSLSTPWLFYLHRLWKQVWKWWDIDKSVLCAADVHAKRPFRF